MLLCIFSKIGCRKKKNTEISEEIECEKMTYNFCETPRENKEYHELMRKKAGFPWEENALGERFKFCS